jgi:hypothetical protein
VSLSFLGVALFSWCRFRSRLNGRYGIHSVSLLILLSFLFIGPLCLLPTVALSISRFHFGLHAAAVKQQAFDGTHSAFSTSYFSLSPSVLLVSSTLCRTRFRQDGGFGAGFRRNTFGFYATSTFLSLYGSLLLALSHCRFHFRLNGGFGVGFSALSPINECSYTCCSHEASDFPPDQRADEFTDSSAYESTNEWADESTNECANGPSDEPTDFPADKGTDQCTEKGRCDGPAMESPMVSFSLSS